MSCVFFFAASDEKRSQCGRKEYFSKNANRNVLREDEIDVPIRTATISPDLVNLRD